jgi:hypothetical protein
MGLLLLAGSTGFAQPQQLHQYAYYRVRPRPDTALTRQAQQLRLDFDQAGWATLAGELSPKPRPVWSYIGPGVGQWQRAGRRNFYYQVPAASLPALRRGHVRHSTKQFGNHMFELGLERRKSDYERLSDILLTHATKVRRIREAVPVLLFSVDTLGQVRDVAVDKSHSRMGLTSRSRKLILKALEKEQFRALEARVLFRRPRPVQERWQRLRVAQRLGRAGNAGFGWLLYKKVIRYGRCHEEHIERVPRFWKER